MKRSPLLRKTLATLVFVFGVTMAATAGSTVWRMRAYLTEQYASKGTAIADSIASSSVETLLFRDVSTIQSTIDQFLEIEGVAYIVVVDPEDEVLAHTFYPVLPDEMRTLQRRPRETLVQNVTIEGRGEFLSVSSPLLAGKVGYVHVGMDLGQIRSAIWTAVAKQSALMLTIFVSCLLLAYSLMNKLVEPLNRLTDYANTLAAGVSRTPETRTSDAAIQPITARTDEIGQLARAFQEMVLEVSAREAQLRTAHDELERRVRERTNELEQANAHLQEEIAVRKEAEDEVRETAQELARSNGELEQFAYVASHDLQEPLRMVASYVDLLSQRYKEQLDEKAQRWIGFAVDAATRMKQLINDLLEFSRVSTRGKEFAKVDCDKVFSTVLANLQQVILESGGAVSRGELPAVLGDVVQVTQLFQNLISNAIKYHGPEPPRVSIEAVRQEDVWQFSVCDNGIGIDSQFHERIFVIFQRLHTRTEYAGTGIGLALCKKIVERHGGRIWVESQPGLGATFHFTLPDVKETPDGDELSR